MFRVPRGILAALSALALVAVGVAVTQAQSSSIAAVRAIHRGLTVQPPHQPGAPGKVRQPLFAADGLQTLAQQKASVGFVDSTVLFINQRTSLVLASPHLIRVGRGEVAPVDVPASHLRIQTPSAVAGAIGTRFDVWITPKLGPYGRVPPGYRKDQIIGPAGTTTVSVVAGLVRVTSPYGAVTVHAGQWTHVRPGRPPTPPNGHNARQDIAWTAGLR